MYDIFISFKYTDAKSGEVSEDYHIAKAIYDELVARGMSVFFSPPSLEELAESDWRKVIDEAIRDVNYLILVGTSTENMGSKQVEYEWRTSFLEEIANGRRQNLQMITCTKGLDLNDLADLDTRLRNSWSNFDCGTKTVGEICDFVERKVGRRVRITAPDQRAESAETGRTRQDSKYRFRYTGDYTRLKGRDREMSFLREFCEGDNSPISWTAVYGKGGVGKSKLALEFCRVMEAEGWRVFEPSHARVHGDEIKKSITQEDTDILVCFDYVKYEIDYVEDIIRFASEYPRLARRIRFVLIERNKEDLEGGFASVIQNYQYRGGHIELEPLDDDSILAIIEDYKESSRCNRPISDEDKRLLIDTLEAIDPGIHRPLFALFIADAWIDSAETLKQWDREAALDYVTGKETDRIEKAAKGDDRNPEAEKRYLTALRSAAILATFCGTVPREEVVEKCSERFNVPKDSLRQMTFSCGLAGGDDLHGIEPDLVGEYMCLRLLNIIEKEAAEYLLSELMSSYFISSIAFIDKVYSDYRDIFMNAEWYHHCTQITIPAGISRISNNMFRGFNFVESVHLHEHVARIAKGAFRECENLKMINFPHDLETIEEDAFRDCSALEEAMPDDEKGWIPSIVRIGERAFMNCVSLKEVLIPDSVKMIGSRAFSNCSSMYWARIPKDVSVIDTGTFESCTSLETMMFRVGKTLKPLTVREGAFRGCTALQEIDGVRFISLEESAFEDCRNLKTINLSQMCERLGDKVFKGCESLRAVDFRKTNISAVGDGCFENCTQLVTAEFPNRLQRIGERCFYGCEKLTGFILPRYLKTIGAMAFRGSSIRSISSEGIKNPEGLDFCGFRTKAINGDVLKFIISYDQLEEVSFPPEITEIGRRAFFGNKNLREVTIGKGIVSIGEEAFAGCTGLVKINGSFSGITYIEKGAFRDCCDLKEIPGDGNPAAIPDEAFRGCSSLEQLSFSSNINEIGREAFMGCAALTNLAFPGKCGSVGTLAFHNCGSFRLSKEDHIEDRSGSYYVGGFIFDTLGEEELRFVSEYIEQEDIRIPDSCIGFFDNPFAKAERVRHIIVPESATCFIKGNFEGIGSLRSIDLPMNIKTLEAEFFKNCISLETVRIGGGEPNHLPDDLVIQERAFEGCASIKYVRIPAAADALTADNVFWKCSSLTEIVIPEGVTHVGDYTFRDCSSLRSITLPAGMTAIGTGAFGSCVMLESVALPGQLETIGSYAFADCQNLKEIDMFRTAVTSIGEAAFIKCSKLQKVIIPPRVKEICDSTFRSCSQLETVILPPQTERIGNSAFTGCTELKNIDLRVSRELKEIGEKAFSYCYGLKNMSIPDSVDSLPGGIFIGCINLEEVSFGSGIDSIPNNCFKNCRSLKRINNTAVIKKIGMGAFRNCFSISDFSPFRDAEECGVGAFRGCLSLAEASLEKVDVINVALFLGCSSLKKVEFGPVNRILNYAFCECTALTEVSLGNVMESIGYGAFWGCTSLAEASFSDSLKRIFASAFRNCTSLKEVIIPDGLTEIGHSSFRDDISLDRVVLPASVEHVRGSAFRGCTALKSVEFGADHVWIDHTAFEGCEDLYYVILHGTATIQNIAFRGTPAEAMLMEDPRVTMSDNDRNQNDSVVEDRHIGRVDTDDFLCRIENGGICIEKYKNRSIVVEVPDHIKEYPVKHIGNECFRNNREIKVIDLPDSIETIGKGAFSGCGQLAQINLGSGVRSIGSEAFRWCDNLESISLPEGLEEVAEKTFMFCYALKEAIIPQSLRVIRSCAFLGCVNLSMTVPSTVESIEEDAFVYCNKETISFENGSGERYFDASPVEEAAYTEEDIDDGTDCYEYNIHENKVYLKKYTGRKKVVKIPERIEGVAVRHIGKCCFQYNETLRVVIIPDTVRSIGDDAFDTCKQLRQVEFGRGVNRIGKYAFKKCKNIRRISLPEKLEKIDIGVFMNCFKLKDIRIPEGVKEIFSAAFWRCEELKLDVPPTVAYIATGAFRGCKKENLHFPNGAAPRYFEEWPFGEKIIDDEKGEGVITSCKYIGFKTHKLVIEYKDRTKETLVYPEEFGESKRFVSEHSITEHKFYKRLRPGKKPD